ncbi:MAG: hypothetical protein J1E05_08855 [Eubacterium sp.]|nr:hypothetical protein [Eubacterium sp.]
MKKTKLIASVVSLALACVLCIGLTACGSDAANVNGEEITAGEWAAAFSAGNFKNVKIETETINEGEFFTEGANDKLTTKTTYVIADGKQYMKIEATVQRGSEELEAMAEKMNRVAYISATEVDYSVWYTKDEDGKWQMSLNHGDVASEIVESLTVMASMFDKFYYESANKGYELIEQSSYGNTTYKFKHGKLAATYHPSFTYKENDNQTYGVTTTQSMTITYGDQKVNLPNVEGTATYNNKVWLTYQLYVEGVNDGNPFNIDDHSIPGIGRLYRESFQLVTSADGIARAHINGDDVTGIWGMTADGIEFYSDSLGDDPINIERDGNYLTMEIPGDFDGFKLTAVLEKVQD